jgi:hypothetical protein
MSIIKGLKNYVVIVANVLVFVPSERSQVNLSVRVSPVRLGITLRNAMSILKPWKGAENRAFVEWVSMFVLMGNKFKIG